MSFGILNEIGESDPEQSLPFHFAYYASKLQFLLPFASHGLLAILACKQF